MAEIYYDYASSVLCVTEIIRETHNNDSFERLTILAS